MSQNNIDGEIRENTGGSKVPDGDKHPDVIVRGAIAMLKTWNNVGSQKRVKVPFNVDMDPPYRLKKKDLNGAHHDKVQIVDLIATQPTVERKRLKKYIKQEGKYNGIPTVVKVHKRYYIYNGHHRATADYLLGKKKMRCNVLDIEDGE